MVRTLFSERSGRLQKNCTRRQNQGKNSNSFQHGNLLLKFLGTSVSCFLILGCVRTCSSLLLKTVSVNEFVLIGGPVSYDRLCMAQTPWGDLPVNDAHVHFFSHKFYSALARQKKLENAEAVGPLLNWEIPPHEPAMLAQSWAAELDRHGVHRASLIASMHGDEESVSTAVAAYPDRFFGYFMLDPLQPDALERVRAAAVNPNLHCMCLFPAMHTYSFADRRLVPMLEIASDHRLAVFVHCGTISVGVRKKLGLPSQFDMRFSNPLDVHPVALHFPQIRFIVPHFGAGLFREALMLADLCPNIWLDTSSSNRWTVYENLDLRTVFRRSIDVIGEARLLFGTDSSFFPRGWHAEIFKQQITALYELGLSKEQAEQILCLNLERVLKPTIAAAQSGTKTSE
jgi:predicted TIM-barrel fold metal-dependent hydrolase